MDTKAKKTSQSQKILLTAFQCLSTKGYANVSMRDIADEAGVALSQLNYYYKNKEGLFTEVVKMMMHQYLHEVEEKLKSTANTKDKITSLVKFFDELIRKDPELLRLFIDFTAQSLWLPSFRRQLKNLFADLAEMIEKGILAGLTINKNLSEYSSKSVAKMVLGALYGTSIQIMLDSDPEENHESLNLIGLILN